jgi:cytochrome c peroxidase
MKTRRVLAALTGLVFVGVLAATLSGQGGSGSNRPDGQQLFERETFGGNGRTCATCHSRATGTVSPSDAQARFQANPNDPLFLHDGSDDGNGHGVTRMLTDATILMKIPLHPNVRLADSDDRFVIVRRGIPTTLNTSPLDPVLMVDGRQPSLELQASGAIHDHAQATIEPSLNDLELIKQFQTSEAFFTSPALIGRSIGGADPGLPAGRTESERRGRRFFEHVPPDPNDFRPGLCSHCHSGPLMNQTNEFAPQFFGVPVKTGTRFSNILVSFFNKAKNPVREFIFNAGTPQEFHLLSPDPGRSLITGVVDDPITFENIDAFKIPQLRGVRHTAPYFHDNSAKTLEDVAAHYAQFFSLVTGGAINLTAQDQADIVAFLKLID